MDKIQTSKKMKIILYHLDTFPQFHPQNAMEFLISMINDIYFSSNLVDVIGGLETGLQALNFVGK